MPTPLRRFWIRLTADRKRFGLLCGALLVGLLLWARLIVVSQPPRMAIAVPIPTKGSSVAPLPGVNGASSNPGADNQKKVNGAVTRERAPIAVELFANPSHDPFVISPLYFPKPSAIAQPIEQLPKSGKEPAEDSVQAQARIGALRQAMVDRMKLEAAFGNAWAVIDGRKYRVGQTIQSTAGTRVEQSGLFKLAEIRQRSVVLECEGRHFELQMATPGS